MAGKLRKSDRQVEKKGEMLIKGDVHFSVSADLLFVAQRDKARSYQIQMARRRFGVDFRLHF